MSFPVLVEPGATSITGSVPDTINVTTPSVIDPTSTTSLSLLIGGVEKNAYISNGTLSIELAVAQRGTARFDLIDPAKSYRPAIGSPVVIKNNGVTLFAGSIDRIEEDWPTAEGRRVLRQRIECVDKARALDRRFVSIDFASNLPISILINNILIYNNIPVTDLKGAVTDLSATVNGGFRVNMVSLKQAIDKATQAVNYTWWVNEEGQLVLRNPVTAPISAPYTLGDTASKFGDFTVSESLEEYANRVIVRTEFQMAQTYTETFTADGTTTQFFTKFPISSVLSVTEDGTPKTVGTITGDYFSGNLKDWYYEPNETIDIQTLAPRSPVANGVEISVTYKGPSSNLAISEDTTAQAARAAVEGNSGIYEAVYEAKDFADSAAAQAYADALLAKHKQIPKKIRFVSRYNGWRPGQTVTATLSDANLSSEDFLIERVTIRDDNYVDGRPFRLIYECEGNNVQEVFAPTSGDTFFETVVEWARGGSDPETVDSLSVPPVSGGSGSVVAIFNYTENLGAANSADEALTTGDDKTIRRALRFGATTSEVEFTEVFAFVTPGYEPTGAALQFDIRYVDENGDDQGSIFSSTASIAAGESEATITSFAITKVRHGGYLVLDVDQIGSTYSGARLGVYVSGTPL